MKKERNVVILLIVIGLVLISFLVFNVDKTSIRPDINYLVTRDYGNAPPEYTQH